MKCYVCGSDMISTKGDLPFKVGAQSIIIVKDVPLYQCDNCREYVLSDSVMAQIEAIIARVDATAELEVVRFAA